MDGSAPHIEGLDVTLGQATESMATVYFRPRFVGLGTAGDTWRLTGTVRGPRCRVAETLPAEFALEDLGREPTWLAAARIFEPCYWTPELPFQYEVTVELRDESDGNTVASHTAITGFTRLAARGRGWVLGGRAFTLRGVARMPEDQAAWEALRGESLAVWARDDSAKYCSVDACKLEQASDAGVFVVSASEPTPWPAHLSTTAEPLAGSIVTPLERLGEVVAESPDRPVIVTRVEPGLPATLDADGAKLARRAVERLQRDCAPHTDLAGYVVV